MRKLISLSLILTFLVPAMAQQKVRDKAQRAADADETAQRKIEEAQRKPQAVDILKGVVESAAEIQETRTRVAILTGALDLLWKHDEAYARANFIDPDRLTWISVILESDQETFLRQPSKTRGDRDCFAAAALAICNCC